MNLKLISFLVLTISVIFSPQIQCAERFKDEEMMKSHHNHPNLQKQSNDIITVHLIPHSHDDVGWLKTVDDYYYGGDMSTQFAGVQYTIDSVVQELSNNPSYKFSIVEVAFLYRWWNQATQTQRDQMKKLYQNGQIQFINGGWCMSDEAAPYYEDVIDQMTIGHRWLKETFGSVPTIAWHIDPFGHQSSSASMFSRMGMQAFFFARIDYQDKSLRLQNKGMEMVWRPTQYTKDDKAYLFTHVNYYHYSPPPGFCFDIRCTDEPIKDDPTLEDYNLDSKSDKLVNYFKSMALHFRSNNLMHTLGEDFHFVSARMWFKNYDKLLKYINDRSAQYGMKILYSTPSQYIDAIQKQGKSYPQKFDDFFPYADVQHGYWTGYFTSRTGLKGFVREFGRWIQAARKHISELKISNSSSFIVQNADKVEQMIWNLETAQGILQHHDGVSGTSKQKVAYDYVNTALRALKLAASIYSNIKSEQISKQIGEIVAPESLYFNVFWNQTAKFTGVAQKLAANQPILVNLHNPGAKGTYEIKINVPAFDLNVLGANNQLIQGDVMCGNTVNNTETCELIFNLQFAEASNNYVKIMRAEKSTASAKVVDLIEYRVLEKTKDWTISSNVALTITRANLQFDLKIGGQTQTFFVGYKYYESYQFVGQKGGAYIFRPASDASKPYSNIKKVYSLDGTQSLVIVLEGSNTLTKLYFSKRAGYVENWGIGMETFLDSIPIDDNIGKEVVLSLKTNYDNSNKFFTDSNGLQEQVRILNFRPTWNLTVHEAVAGNYYPINSHIRMTDSATLKSITVLTDRSVGGSVINKGEIELLIHRRLLADDARGVDENLNQTEEINGKKVGLTQSIRNYIVFGSKYRQVQKAKDQKIMVTLAKSSSSSFAKNQLREAPIKVPDNVKLYLRPFADGSYLLRLHNMNEATPSPVIIPDGWTLTQLTMSANQLWYDWYNKQYKWNEVKSAKDDSSFIEDISETVDDSLSLFTKLFRPKPVSKGLSASQINLRPFDLVTYKLTRS